MAEHVIGRAIEPDLTGTFMTTPHQSWRMIDYGNDGMVSEDPLFGPHIIGGTPENMVIADVARTPAFYRTYDLAQLSKLKGEGAISNITLFSTAGGNICQLPFIRYAADKLRATPEQYLGFVIAQAITDVSHGHLRHVADMEAEGLRGKQVFHEQRKMSSYALGGVLDVFEKHKVKITSDGYMEGITIPPCIESGRPYINADNFQYVVAEMYEWFAGQENHANPEVARMSQVVVERLKRLGSFAHDKIIDIDEDGHIVFEHDYDALFFQKCQMLASTEDWKEPIHRVLTHQYVQDLKYHKIARTLPWMSDIDNGRTLHPHGYMDYVDSNIVTAQMTADGGNDEYLHISRNLKKHISQEERERFVNFKLRRYAEFLCDDFAVDYPNEMINGHVVKYGRPSSRVEIIKKEDIEPTTDPISSTGATLAPADMQSEEGITYVLDPLKNRVVRPFVKGKNGEKVFLDKCGSRLGKASAALYDQHQSLQWQRLTVRLVATRDYAKALKRTYARVEDEYNELLTREPLSLDQRRRLIGNAALSAKQFALDSGLLVIAA